MRALLEARNRSLLRDLEQLGDSLASSGIPSELEPYRTRLLTVCDSFQKQCERNVKDLDRGRDEILEDVLSNTQQATQAVRLLSAKLATPVLRASSEDRLCLKTIGWLHRCHGVTASLPAAFADGECAIWPFLGIAPVYFFPSAEQRGLLFQPLYFHEFGHLLYACHKPEMDDLVRDLQKAIEDLLKPAAERNDRHSAVKAEERQAIAYTWYRWAQELFCDMVGLTIGGPCFLRAFSGYLGTMDRGDFYREPDDLRFSTHPVKWLRIKLLIERAKGAGFAEVARDAEEEWKIVATTMGVSEDYHGFYDKTFEVAVLKTLDDMLIEAGPRSCSGSEAGAQRDAGRADSIVAVLNEAWRVYISDSAGYPSWESATLRKLLAG